MNFIKLTESNSKQIIISNTKHIIEIVSAKSDSNSQENSRVDYINGDCRFCKESPEEILKLIKEAK